MSLSTRTATTGRHMGLSKDPATQDPGVTACSPAFGTALRTAFGTLMSVVRGLFVVPFAPGFVV